MAVGTGSPQVTYTGNGVSTIYAYPFTLLSASDLAVTIDGVVTTAFSVSGIGASSGGNIVFAAPPANGAAVAIRRSMTLDRAGSDYQNNGDFLADTIDLDLDRIWLAMQERVAEFQRTLRVPFPETTNELPALAGRANQIAGWDSDGNMIAVSPVNGSAAAFAIDLANTSDPTKGDALVGVKSVLSGGVGRTQHAKNADVVSALDLGAVGDGTTDDRAALLAAFTACAAAGRLLVLPCRVYAVSDWLTMPSGLRVWFEPGAKIKLTGASSVGGVWVGGYTEALATAACDDVEIHNPTIDANNLSGENGINAARCTNLRIFNPTVLNCLHDTTILGGRAFQFEGNDANGVHVFNPYIRNCSIGINSQADPNAGTQKARDINYYNVVMRDVDVPFNVDAGFASPENWNLEQFSTFVHGASLFDCGKPSWSGATALGAGIVCGDRGSGLSIDGLRVVNSTGYGTIGALVRGMVYGVRLRNVEFNAAATALYDSTYVVLGNPSASAIAATLFTENVRARGNLDYVVRGPFDNWGACTLHAEVSNASLTGVLDATSGTVTAALLHFVDADTKQSTGWQRFKDVFDGGNAAANFTAARTGFASVRHVVSIPDEAAVDVFSVLAPAQCRLSIAYFVSVMYPDSASEGSVRNQHGMIAFELDAGSNEVGQVSAGTTAVAVDPTGPATQTVTVTAALVSGSIVVSVSQNNEPLDAELLCMISADIHFSVGQNARAPKVTLL
jgi:hypothetical protein